MWAWRGVLCVSLAWGLALDSNTIRSSKEAELQVRSRDNRGGCSNRAQRRPAPTEGFNGTTDAAAAAAAGGCVRSGDCGAGLCCVRYLTGKRCQPIPGEGDACLLRGPAKRRRNLGRCDCGGGLSCGAAPRPGGVKGQGVCLPRQRRGQRKTRHSGKKRRTAERSC